MQKSFLLGQEPNFLPFSLPLEIEFVSGIIGILRLLCLFLFQLFQWLFFAEH